MPSDDFQKSGFKTETSAVHTLLKELIVLYQGRLPSFLLPGRDLAYS